MKMYVKNLFLLPVMIAGLGLIPTGRVMGQTFKTLHSFGFYSASDGARPTAGLILWGDALYGTAYNGGDLGHGTVFKVNTDGLGFRTLHLFRNSIDGVGRRAG